MVKSHANKSLERKCTKTIFKLEFKRKQDWTKCMLCTSLITKPWTGYKIGATVNSYEKLPATKSYFGGLLSL